jgi:hypothetical protein
MRSTRLRTTTKFAEDFFYFGFAETAPPFDSGEDGIKTVGKAVKHRLPS